MANKTNGINPFQISTTDSTSLGKIDLEINKNI